MVDKVFKDLIGRTMEVYVDDMLVKSVVRTNYLQHLGKAFDLLRKYKVKLNPEKFTFIVAFGKFLGYLVTQRGIEADHDQISTILSMKSLTCVKEVQMLNGHVAALNRFISRSIDKCKPFFQALKKNEADFRWNEDCESFPRFEEISGFTTTLIEAHLGRNIVPLSSHLGVSCERGVDS